MALWTRTTIGLTDSVAGVSPAISPGFAAAPLRACSGCAEPKALSTINRSVAARLAWEGRVVASRGPFVTTVTGQRALDLAQGGGLIGYVVGKTTANQSAKTATEQFRALRNQAGSPECGILADSIRNELERAGFHVTVE